jgi:hypothetical protein
VLAGITKSGAPKPAGPAPGLRLPAGGPKRAARKCGPACSTARGRWSGPADHSHTSREQALQIRTAELRRVFAKNNEHHRRSCSACLQQTEPKGVFPCIIRQISRHDCGPAIVAKRDRNAGPSVSLPTMRWSSLGCGDGWAGFRSPSSVGFKGAAPRWVTVSAARPRTAGPDFVRWPGVTSGRVHDGVLPSHARWAGSAQP